MKGHNYDHGKGDKCKKCGKMHTNPMFGKKNPSALKKGNIPWNKGKVVPKETYPNYGMRGKCHSIETKIAIGEVGKGRVPWNKGLSKETDKRLAKLGHKISKTQTGKKHSKEWRENISKGLIGHKAWNKALTKETDSRVLRISKANACIRHTKEWNDKVSESLKGRSPSLETIEKIRKSVSGKTPTKETRRKMSASRRAFLETHPEMHPNRLVKRISEPQRELFHIVRKMFKEAELEYPIKTEETLRFADIGIPSLKVDVEFDCEYWHDDKEDMKRDAELASIGWSTIRIDYDLFDKIMGSKSIVRELLCA